MRCEMPAKRIPTKKSSGGWVSNVRSLLSEIAYWAEIEKWPVQAPKKTIQENGGTYKTGQLYIKTPQGWVFVEPIAEKVCGDAKGRVDMYAYPTMHRALLVWDGRKWHVRADPGIRPHRVWN